MKLQDSCRLSTRIFVALAMCFMLPSTSVLAEEWITEEVLKQLSEVRQELKALKEEVKSLRSVVENAKPAARAEPKAGPIDIAGAPAMGSDDAPVAIIEFSDYECPFCRRHFRQTLPQIEKTYVDTGKVKYVMKQFPLGFHAKAKGASIAALCVEKIKPGLYFKAHEAIFSGKVNLNQESYLSMAGSLGVSKPEYQRCLIDPAMSAAVDRDMAQGERSGVSGTPAFLIGRLKDGKLVDGRLVSGARPFQSFSSAIEPLL